MRPLDAALITRHLQFSLPYRALFSSTLRADTAARLLDALAALLVRMHTAGFYWGDCSFSNTLFRRDAGRLRGVPRRRRDRRAARRALRRAAGCTTSSWPAPTSPASCSTSRPGGLLHESIDPVETSDQVVQRYRSLWDELLGAETFDTGERFRIDQRIRRLNDLGFDVAELTIVTDIEGRTVHLEPKVVDAGHHSRRLLRLTGLDVEENQARRLLNDLDAYRAAKDVQNEDEEIVAHRWVAEAFEPVVRAVPKDLRGKLEPAEVFHEVLEHRWFLSERAGVDVGLLPGRGVLRRRRADPQARRGGRARLAHRHADRRLRPLLGGRRVERESPPECRRGRRCDCAEQRRIRRVATRSRSRTAFRRAPTYARPSLRRRCDHTDALRPTLVPRSGVAATTPTRSAYARPSLRRRCVT